MLGITHRLSIFHDWNLRSTLVITEFQTRHLVPRPRGLCMFLLLEGRGRSRRKSIIAESFESERLSLAHFTNASIFQAGTSWSWRMDVESVTFIFVFGTKWCSELGSSLTEDHDTPCGRRTSCTPEKVKRNLS